MTASQWDRRIQRARTLEHVYPFAGEGLRFYQRVTEAQKSLYSELESHLGKAKRSRPAGALRAEFDIPFLLPRLAPFLSIVEQCAPPALAQSAGEIRAKNGNHSHEMLSNFWGMDSLSAGVLSLAETLLSWTFLQPYAEYLAGHTERIPVDGTPSRCPLCQSRPQVGVLRPEGDGAKRSLICALCAHEWEFRRIVCADCGEEDVRKLAVYTADGIPHVRVEACDTCHCYIKTVNLTKDGHAVPVVDELATIPLNLWASEHGYTKNCTNLLGL